MKATIKQPYFDGLDPSKWQHWPRRKASKDPSVWYHLRGSSRILGVSSNMAGKSPIDSGKCYIYRWLWWFLPAVNLHVEGICQPPLRKPEGDCWGSSSHAKKHAPIADSAFFLDSLHRDLWFSPCAVTGGSILTMFVVCHERPRDEVKPQMLTSQQHMDRWVDR